MLANHRPASGFISRIGKGSQQHNSTVVQKSEQTFLLRHTNGQQHMKRCSTPLIIRERSKLQSDMTSRWSEWPSSKYLQTINAGEGLEKRELSYNIGGNVNGYNHDREEHRGSFKNVYRTII